MWCRRLPHLLYHTCIQQLVVCVVVSGCVWSCVASFIPQCGSIYCCLCFVMCGFIYSTMWANLLLSVFGQFCFVYATQVNLILHYVLCSMSCIHFTQWKLLGLSVACCIPYSGRILINDVLCSVQRQSSGYFLLYFHAVDNLWFVNNMLYATAGAWWYMIETHMPQLEHGGTVNTVHDWDCHMWWWKSQLSQSENAFRG